MEIKNSEPLVGVGDKTTKKTEDMKEYKKQYYLQHKAHLMEIMMKEVECECGFKTASCNLGRHQKTKLHLKKLKMKESNLSKL